MRFAPTPAGRLPSPPRRKGPHLSPLPARAWLARSAGRLRYPELEPGTLSRSPPRSVSASAPARRTPAAREAQGGPPKATRPPAAAAAAAPPAPPAASIVPNRPSSPFLMAAAPSVSQAWERYREALGELEDDALRVEVLSDYARSLRLRRDEEERSTAERVSGSAESFPRALELEVVSPRRAPAKPVAEITQYVDNVYAFGPAGRVAGDRAIPVEPEAARLMYNPLTAGAGTLPPSPPRRRPLQPCDLIPEAEWVRLPLPRGGRPPSPSRPPSPPRSPPRPTPVGPPRPPSPPRSPPPSPRYRSPPPPPPDFQFRTAPAVPPGPASQALRPEKRHSPRLPPTASPSPWPVPLAPPPPAAPPAPQLPPPLLPRPVAPLRAPVYRDAHCAPDRPEPREPQRSLSTRRRAPREYDAAFLPPSLRPRPASAPASNRRLKPDTSVRGVRRTVHASTQTERQFLALPKPAKRRAAAAAPREAAAEPHWSRRPRDWAPGGSGSGPSGGLFVAVPMPLEWPPPPPPPPVRHDPPPPPRVAAVPPPTIPTSRSAPQHAPPTSSSLSGPEHHRPAAASPTRQPPAPSRPAPVAKPPLSKQSSGRQPSSTPASLSQVAAAIQNAAPRSAPRPAPQLPSRVEASPPSTVQASPRGPADFQASLAEDPLAAVKSMLHDLGSEVPSTSAGSSSGDAHSGSILMFP